MFGDYNQYALKELSEPPLPQILLMFVGIQMLIITFQYFSDNFVLKVLMKNDVIFAENNEKNRKNSWFPLIIWISRENPQIRQNLSGNEIIFGPKFQNPCVMTHSIARFFTFWVSFWFPQKIKKKTKKNKIWGENRECPNYVISHLNHFTQILLERCSR